MWGSVLIHLLGLLMLSDVVVVDSQTGPKTLGNHEVGVPDWAHFNPPQGPHFAEGSPKQVTAAVGSPAHLPCKVRNLGSKSVSWIRHRDLHVLTVGSFTFTTDDRFSAQRDSSTGDWVLVLRRPQPSDSGLYECSISTKPVTAMSVKMEVVVPASEMVGEGGSVFLDRGSTLNLTCIVHFSPSPPEFVLWYHREKLVNYGSKEGRDIKVVTEHQGETTRSSLLVLNATMSDSGRYSCKPSNAQKVSIGVHVLKSETPAAMQTTNSGSSSPFKASSAVLNSYLMLAVLMMASLSLPHIILTSSLQPVSALPIPCVSVFSIR